ncbi:hypothetical protein NLJ89_g2024 [Agrocybe chaxingu]|uniref:pyranose dehydrogenase (acceptor) n=1 Tax=Agrocybe chaxingu TaxID=84603 RepID=A0A9W8KCQ4_9AGAR|nr:hypothetical protein NLJ89_g2024 [Agrocybe chaxingu]
MKFAALSTFYLSFLQKSWFTEILPDVPNVDTFDYIVVGGGNAGLTVANRLSENPAVSVVVLEAGPNVERLPEVYIPGLVGFGQSFTTLNWAYQTVPQEHLGGRRTTIAAGKALGGSTVINSMIFPRAEKEQYNAWGTLNNNDTAWTWDAILPYFKRSETIIPPTLSQLADGVRYQPDAHGAPSDATVDHPEKEGRVKVGFPNFIYPQSQMWHEASGLRPSPDLSNGDPQGHVGISINSLNARNNTRCSSVCAYYTPNADRPNLAVMTNATVTRILWDRSQQHTAQSPISSGEYRPLRAAGVELTSSDGVVRTLWVAKEVFLAAGAIASPKILELSGVGNATILMSAGIKPVLELSTVGENLADHVHGWANAFTNASVTRDLLRLDPVFEKDQRDLWYHNRTGVLSAAPRSLGLVAASSLFPSSDLRTILQAARDDIKLYARRFSNGNENLAKGIELQHSLMLDLWVKDRAAPVEINYEPGYSGPTSFEDRPRRKYSSVNAVLFSTLSRGRTHISSSDPLALPAIDPGYYAHPLDFATHVRSIELGRKMLRTAPLDTIYEEEYEPGPDRSVESYAREVAASDNHVVGSLAMMPQELGGVVDTRLRVYGIRNVRVVDASIIPFPISGHICSTVYMIAEKAADMIKEDASHS